MRLQKQTRRRRSQAPPPSSHACGFRDVTFGQLSDRWRRRRKPDIGSFSLPLSLCSSSSVIGFLVRVTAAHRSWQRHRRVLNSNVLARAQFTGIRHFRVGSKLDFGGGG